jgi:hypothetical protein
MSWTLTYTGRRFDLLAPTDCIDALQQTSLRLDATA